MGNAPSVTIKFVFDKKRMGVIDSPGEGAKMIFERLIKATKEMPNWELNSYDENALDFDAFYSTPTCVR